MGYARVNIELLNNAKITPTGDDWKIPEDIQNGKAVTFRFEYEWASDNTTCNISNIKWYPSQYHQDTTTPSNSTWWPIINATGTSITNGTKISFDSNGVFDQTGKIKLTFGSTIRAITDKKLSGCYSGNNLNALKDTNTNTNVMISVTNIQAPQLFGSFEYSYKVRYIDYDEEGKNGTWVNVNSTSEISEYSDIEYFIKIDNIRIPKTSKYRNNVVFTKAGVNELIEFIRRYPITKIEEVTNSTTWSDYTQGKPCLKVTYGGGDTSQVFSGYKKADGTNQSATTAGFQYIPVGSNIKFLKIDGTNEELSALTAQQIGATQSTGTFRVKINSDTFEVPIMGLAGGSGAVKISGHLLPATNATYDLGGDKDALTKLKWRNLYLSGSLGDSNNYIPNAYITTINTHNTSTNKAGPNGSSVAGDTGYFNNLYVNGNSIDTTNLNEAINGSTDDTTKVFWRGDANWSDTLEGSFTLAANKSAYLKIGAYGGNYGTSGTADLWYNASSSDVTPSGSTTTYKATTLYCNKNFAASKVYNAVFNDYAECRTTIDLTPGHVVVDQDDGSLVCSSKRLQPGAQVISDTFGHLMGETDIAKTPLAVAGRVLVYTYQPRENYHAGMAVCSAPDGTVDIMSRAEICEYPDCIVGIVSEIPDYEIWGSDNVKVDGRIWIKVH